MPKRLRYYLTPHDFVERDPKLIFALLDSADDCYHDTGWLCLNCLSRFSEALRLIDSPWQMENRWVSRLFDALMNQAEPLGLQAKRRWRNPQVQQALITTLSFLNADLRHLDKLPGIGPHTRDIGLRLQQALGMAVLAQRAVHGLDASRFMDFNPETRQDREHFERFAYRLYPY